MFDYQIQKYDRLVSFRIYRHSSSDECIAAIRSIFVDPDFSPAYNK